MLNKIKFYEKNERPLKVLIKIFDTIICLKIKGKKTE